MPLIVHWFQAFLWTLGIELAVAAVVLRNHVPIAHRLSLITVANIATHPAVWLIFPELGAGQHWPSWFTLALSEAWAFGFEAFVYALFLGRDEARIAITASVAANAASLGLGYALRAVGLV
jgi:hypothetical protein